MRRSASLASLTALALVSLTAPTPAQAQARTQAPAAATQGVQPVRQAQGLQREEVLASSRR
ncbi:MAG: hypothetical protein ACT6SC_05935, partial [Blastomonas fulva]